MNENNITRFEVSNFKKFEHLVVENIGQVNLITGDNNVGKTTLLEALLLEPNIKKIISALALILQARNFKFEKQEFNLIDAGKNQKSNIIGLFQKNISDPILLGHTYINSNINFSIYNEITDVINTPDAIVKAFASNLKVYPEIDVYSKNWILFYLERELRFMVDITSKYYNAFFDRLKYIPFIPETDFFKDDLIDIYNKIVTGVDSKNYFLDKFNSIFPETIIDISTFIERTSTETYKRFNIATKTNKEYHSLTQYGGGFIRVFRILIEIMSNNNRLMIDEIDAGIHHMKMKEVWKMIFYLSDQFGVQIFANTHSNECIGAFAQAAEEIEGWGEKIRLIELTEVNVKGHNKMFADTYNLDNINSSIISEQSMRGGRIYGKY